MKSMASTKERGIIIARPCIDLLDHYVAKKKKNSSICQCFISSRSSIEGGGQHGSREQNGGPKNNELVYLPS